MKRVFSSELFRNILRLFFTAEPELRPFPSLVIGMDPKHFCNGGFCFSILRDVILRRKKVYQLNIQLPMQSVSQAVVLNPQCGHIFWGTQKSPQKIDTYRAQKSPQEIYLGVICFWEVC